MTENRRWEREKRPHSAKGQDYNEFLQPLVLSVVGHWKSFDNLK